MANKDNSGALFKNEERATDTHPHAKGTAMIGGKDFWISAWTNTAPDGTKYQSLKFKEKEARQGGEAPPAKKAAPEVDPDVPF